MQDIPKEGTIWKILKVVSMEGYLIDGFIKSIDVKEDIGIDKLGVDAGDIGGGFHAGARREVPQLPLANVTGIRILESEAFRI